MIRYRPGRTRGKLAAGSQTLIAFSAHDLPFFERYRTRKSRTGRLPQFPPRRPTMQDIRSGDTIRIFTKLFRTMNIYRISAEGYAMYLFRVAARTQTAACMKLSVLLGIAAGNCRVMETLPLNDHVREIESCRTRVSAR